MSEGILIFLGGIIVVVVVVGGRETLEQSYLTSFGPAVAYMSQSLLVVTSSNTWPVAWPCGATPQYRRSV